MKVMVLGADGYLGWALSLYIGSTTDDQVYLVDNYQKRRWMGSLGVQELHTIPFISERVAHYNQITGKSNLKDFLFSVDRYGSVKTALERIRPDVIINAAQQPSAPYSMISSETAIETLLNNQATCLNVLWAVKEECPETLIVNIGSAGCYLNTDTDFVPREKVELTFGDRNQYRVLNSWLPMQASDIYHESKVNTFGLTDLFTKMWGLRAVTIQQSTIFGQCVSNGLDHHELYSRFTYDHVFGTVLNRFLCQSVAGVPLTVYGSGTDTTGLINLCDCVQRIAKTCHLDVAPGQHIVEHNYTHRLSINQMAERIVHLVGGSIQHIASPRIEMKLKLQKEMDPPSIPIRSSSSDFDEEIIRTLDYVEKYAYNIDQNQMLPTIKWGIK